MKNHQWSIQSMFGDLVLGMREIAEVHDLKPAAVWDITDLLSDLFDTYVWRQWWRNDQRSKHTMARELAVGMYEIVDAHELGDEVVSHLAEVIDCLLENNLALRRTRDASVQELLDELFAIYRGDRDEEPPSGRELLDELLAMYREHRRKTRRPRRRDPHPAMVELLARLDRYGSDHDKTQRKPAPAAG
jgi:hypothetical protein